MKNLGRSYAKRTIILRRYHKYLSKT